MYTITAITKITAMKLQILCHSCANIHATNTKNCQYAMDPHLSAMERKEAFYWIANCLSYKNWQHAYMRLTIYINVRRRRIGKITTTKNILLGFHFALIHIKKCYCYPYIQEILQSMSGNFVRRHSRRKRRLLHRKNRVPPYFIWVDLVSTPLSGITITAILVSTKREKKWK